MCAQPWCACAESIADRGADLCQSPFCTLTYMHDPLFESVRANSCCGAIEMHHTSTWALSTIAPCITLHSCSLCSFQAPPHLHNHLSVPLHLTCALSCALACSSFYTFICPPSPAPHLSPCRFQLGAGQVIPAVEEAVASMKVGPSWVLDWSQGRIRPPSRDIKPGGD